MRTVEQPGVLSYSMSATVMNTPVLLSLHEIRQLYGGESSTLVSTLLMCSHLYLVPARWHKSGHRKSSTKSILTCKVTCKKCLLNILVKQTFCKINRNAFSGKVSKTSKGGI